MKNLNYINCNEITEYDTIVSFKDQPARGVLTGIRASIMLDYEAYVNNFSTIANRSVSTYIDPAKDNLKSCYGIKGIARDNLLDRIVKAQSIEFQETCAYCLYYSRSTIDHYIPQTGYCEFSVLARNLLPACSVCNVTKNDVWRKNGTRLFIHLYNDIIPDYRFLFGNVRYYYGKPTIEFELINVDNNILDDKFALIKSHFELLGLCDLYRRGIPGVFSAISTTINAFRYSLDLEPSRNQIQRILLSTSGRLKQKYGINYWKALAYEILANDEDILNQLATRQEIY